MTFHRAASSAFSALLLFSSGAYSATIDFPPYYDGNANGYHGDPIASNRGAAWTGVAQSFTALDSQITFGVYTAPYTFELTPTQYVFSLYSGDGVFASLLSQKSATFPSGRETFFPLLSVDFSSTSLTANQKYTVAISLPDFALPAAGTFANAAVMYAGSSSSGNANSYSAGTFYYVGSNYNPTSFSDRDLAFKVTAVPEPNS